MIVQTPSRTRVGYPLAMASEAMRRLAVAATRGNAAVLFSEAERYLAAAAKADRATVFLRGGGTWRNWDQLDEGSSDDQDAKLPLPVESVGWDRVRPIAEGIFVPIRAGAVCALVETARHTSEDVTVLGFIASALDLALSTCERQRIASEHLDETQVLQRVATRILKSHDLEEILLLITQEAKRLLGSDICGILLRERDEIVMRRCVGNLSIATASLRMRQGQGLAGRVFATHEPCRVDDYVESSLISRDFFGLAQTERVRSALGAPLLTKNEVIGVLEVWRRRQSTYTEQDTTRLVALANLTSIAIENARLYAAQRSMVNELAEFNRALDSRYQSVRELAQFQQDLVQLLLDGKALSDIAVRAGTHLAAEVLILDVDLRVLAAHPSTAHVPAGLLARLKLTSATTHAQRPGAAKLDAAGRPVHAVPIMIGGESVGLVAILGKEALDDAAFLAVSQTAMAVALFHVEQRAASRARLETLETLLWDLLEGTDQIRRAAVDRAREMHVDLDGPLRVFLCSLESIQTLAVDKGWAAREVDVYRGLVRRICERLPGSLGQPRLLGTRGDLIALIVPDEGTDHSERAANKIALQIEKEVNGLTAHVGVGSARNDRLALASSYREATIAVEVARQRGKAGSAVFDRAGVIGMLLSLRQDSDMRRLVQSTFGALLTKDDHQRDVLTRTLRTFFDTNCSQQATAQKLQVHHKTISYRLGRIGELTGLDLTCHEDRLLADLALYMHSLISGDGK